MTVPTFLNAVIARIDELLRPLGFQHHKRTWNRQSGAFIDVVDVQTSKSGDRFTINAGVFHREIYTKCWATEPAKVIHEPQCIVRARIGELIDNKDLWWSIEAVVSADLLQLLTVHVLPFLDRMHSLEAMEYMLSPQVKKLKYPPPVIYLAIIKSERGDRTDACALLTELGEKTIGVWRSQIAEVAGRLGCL